MKEFCMTRHQCPVWLLNQNAHDKFVEALEGFQQEFDSNGGSRELLQKIYNAGGKWLINHICKIDKQLKETLPADEMYL